jgi:3-dehydroquinate synthase
VAADEKEGGQRALLNLGHTFGHAIETGTGYGTWLHGEAVAIGMYMATELSARLQWIDQADVDHLKRMLEAARLPVLPPASLTDERFLQLMAVDKKVLAGKLRLVLLKAIGQAVVTEDFDHDCLQQMLQQIPRI